MKLKKLLDYKKIDADIINTPLEANLGCGISVRVNPCDKFNVMQTASRAGIGNYSIFLVDASSVPRRVTKIN